MKKWGKLVSVIALSILLVGCGKSNKDAFIETAQKFENSKEFNKQTFDIKIKDIKFNADEDFEVSGQSKAAISMLAAQLKDVKMTGELSANRSAKDPLYNIVFKLGLLGSDLEFSGLLEAETLYLSGQTMISMIDFASQFDSTVNVDPAFKDQMKDSYIKIDSSEFSEGSGEIQDTFLNQSDEYENEYYAFLKTLNKNKFQKKNGHIIHKMDKQEFLDYIKFRKKSADTDSKTSDQELDKAIAALSQGLHNIDIVTDIDPKTNQLNALVTVALKKDDAVLEAVFNVSSRYEKSDEKVTLPPKDKVINKEEFQKISDQYLPNKDTSDSEKLSDEEFNSMFETLETNKDKLAREQIDEYLLSLEDYLTEEQYNKIDNLVPK